MLKNYLKVALRDLRRHKGYTLLNVGGLAIALTSALLIFLYVADELSYDRFYQDADRIYRVLWSDNPDSYRANISPPLSERFLEETLPEVEASTRLFPVGPQMAFVGDRQIDISTFALADSNFFGVFTHPFIDGDPQTALGRPNSVVLTDETARLLFGPEHPVGKQFDILKLNERLGTEAYFLHQTLTVTGLIVTPRNTSYPFGGLISGSSTNVDAPWMSAHTFVRLRERTPSEALKQKLPELARTHIAEHGMGEWSPERQFLLRPLTTTHFDRGPVAQFAPETTGNQGYVWILGMIGFFILILAGVNYVNLATARASTRTRDVGMRKILGSSRGQLICQYLLNSTLYTLIASLLALGLANLLLPTLTTFTGKALNSEILHAWYTVPILACAGLFWGILAGFYPALYLTGIRPLAVLKGGANPETHKQRMRQGLIVFQFAVSILLIAATAFVYGQLAYIRERDLGFDREHVVIVEGMFRLGDRQRQDLFQEEVTKLAGVADAGVIWPMPGQKSTWGHRLYLRKEDVPLSAPDLAGQTLFFEADERGLSTLNLVLKAGRFFRPDEKNSTVILNEAAVQTLGLTNPIGSIVYHWDSGPVEDAAGNVTWQNYVKPLEVVGVIRDYNHASLHERILPTAINPYSSPQKWELLIRINTGDPRGTVAQIEALWKQIQPDMPFVHEWLDQEYDAAYRADKRFGSLLTALSGLAILIACLGMVGLSAFAAERRRKEVSIRKVMGATVQNMVALLSKEFLYLVGIAFVVALPLAYLGVSRWLENFAYRIEITPTYFILAGLIALMLTLASVSYHALRAALTNPADVLRYEA